MARTSLFGAQGWADEPISAVDHAERDGERRVHAGGIVAAVGVGGAVGGRDVLLGSRQGTLGFGSDKGVHAHCVCATVHVSVHHDCTATFALHFKIV